MNSREKWNIMMHILYKFYKMCKKKKKLWLLLNLALKFFKNFRNFTIDLPDVLQFTTFSSMPSQQQFPQVDAGDYQTISRNDLGAVNKDHMYGKRLLPDTFGNNYMGTANFDGGNVTSDIVPEVIISGETSLDGYLGEGEIEIQDHSADDLVIDEGQTLTIDHTDDGLVVNEGPQVSVNTQHQPEKTLIQFLETNLGPPGHQDFMPVESSKKKNPPYLVRQREFIVMYRFFQVIS